MPIISIEEAKRAYPNVAEMVRGDALAPLVGGKLVQEVVAVAAAVEKLHPEVGLASCSRAGWLVGKSVRGRPVSSKRRS